MPDNPYQSPEQPSAKPPDPVAERIYLLRVRIAKEVLRMVVSCFSVTMGFGAAWVALSSGKSSVMLNVGGAALLLFAAGGFGLWATTGRSGSTGRSW